MLNSPNAGFASELGLLWHELDGSAMLISGTIAVLYAALLRHHAVQTDSAGTPGSSSLDFKKQTVVQYL